jgi:hypothetical protein
MELLTTTTYSVHREMTERIRQGVKYDFMCPLSHQPDPDNYFYISTNIIATTLNKYEYVRCFALFRA